MKIRFGDCECCAVMKDEIRFLRSLASPKREPMSDLLPRITFEADQVLSGGDTQTPFDTKAEQEKRQADIDSEAAQILSGNY